MHWQNVQSPLYLCFPVTESVMMTESATSPNFSKYTFSLSETERATRLVNEALASWVQIYTLESVAYYLCPYPSLTLPRRSSCRDRGNNCSERTLAGGKNGVHLPWLDSCFLCSHSKWSFTAVEKERKKEDDRRNHTTTY